MDEKDDRVFKIRFLDIDPTWMAWPATLAMKDRALEILKIQRGPDQPPIDAWTLAMCRENKLPEKLPAYEIGDAIMEDGELRRFIWWLA